MRLIYTKEGFNKNEKEEWRIIIFNNILDGIRITVDAMQEFGIDFEYTNTSVCITLQAKISANSAGPSTYNHARKRPTTLRTHPNRISTGIQGHVERSRPTKSDPERKRICIA
jgi:hypothetical protein